MKKNAQIIIRVSELEKEGFEMAADISGIGLSSWSRQVLRAAAIKQLQEAGQKIIFLEPVKIKPTNNE